MLTYATRQDRPRELLAAPGLTHSACARVLPAFAAASAGRSPPDKPWEGKARQRQSGGGAQGGGSQREDTLLCILVSQQPHPLHTRQGGPLALSHPQPHSWRQRVLPVWRPAFATRGLAPERAASRGAPSPLRRAGAAAGAVDGPERRRHRPPEAAKQRAHYRGQKKAQRDKHGLLSPAETSPGLSRSPTVAGHTPDKTAPAAAALLSPVHSTLDKAPGFPGDEPAGGLPPSPQKAPRPGVER
jgi:hypothetical protein